MIIHIFWYPDDTIKIDLQILGLIENMSYFKCPHCTKPSYIFGKGGARKTADEMELGFVGEVSLYPLMSCNNSF